MPVLPNARHEQFAQQLAQGRTADEAYTLAGYKTDRHHACRLATKGHVRDRLAELQQRSSERAEITKDRLTAMYLEDRALAYKLGQAGAARSATDSLAKLHGLLVNKVEVGNPGDFARMSDDELEAFIAARSHLVCGKVH